MQVCNLTTYPHLMGFFRELGVDTEESDMSFALSTPEVEWGSRGLAAIFAQPGLWRSPKFLLMVWEVIAFGRQAPEVLSGDAKWEGVSLGEYLKQRRYSAFFCTHYVTPMCAAIWSCSDADALAFPVVSMIRFWANHHLLDVVQRPVWRVLKGRSQTYVDACVAALRAMGSEVHEGAKVQSVTRRAAGGVALRVAGRDGEQVFDHVVLATHSNVSLALLGEAAGAEEAAALADIKYQDNEVFLHTDLSLMPRQREVWASWNCIQKEEQARDATSDSARRDAKGGPSVCVSYWINLLQNLPETAADGSRLPDVFVTLNPVTPPAADKTLRQFTLAHPLFNQKALEAQGKLTGELQGEGGVWFVGAWCGYGFHEDGIRSAVHMAEKLCAVKKVTPWEPISCAAKLPLSSQLWTELFTRFGAAMLPQGAALRIVLPNGSERLIGDAAAPPKSTAVLRVIDTALFAKVVLRSDIGLGEAYMDGAFHTPDLFQLLDLLSQASCGTEAKGKTQQALGMGVGMLHSVFERLELVKHQRNSNTQSGSAANISYHYDAGNEFYKLFLDDSMMYSSGIHPGLYAPLEGMSFEQQEASLEAAQMAKLDAMIARAELKPGEHVLEIGCGWGTFGIRMAQKAGVRVTGVTISKEQLAEARQRVKAAGVAHLVNYEFCDYRDIGKSTSSVPMGQFDKVVSIEMLEAVGHEHLTSFFGVVSRSLKPGGLAVIQVITLPDARYEEYCNSHSDFIRTYIFPGGHCPSLTAMIGVGSAAGLELDGCMNIGMDYAVTLRMWRERMMARVERVKALGYPDRFIRMYEFYFVYCEAGFKNGLIHDYQLSWRKSQHVSAPPPADAGPAPVSDPFTRVLLLVWFGLTLVLGADKPQMVAVPATVAVAHVARFALRRSLGLSHARARNLVAHATELLASLASLAFLLLAAVSGPDAAPSVQGFTRLLLSPVTPPSLAFGAQALVGVGAGFSAVHAWESTRKGRAGYWEMLYWAAALICQTAALAYGKYLLLVCVVQLCEGHSALLRLRTVALDAGRAPGAKLWAATWLAFVALRVLPHAALLALLGSAPSALEPNNLYAWGVAVAGLVYLNLSNVASAVHMARAQTADTAAASIATAVWARPQNPEAPPPTASRLPVDLGPATLAVCAVPGLLLPLTRLQEPACQQLVLGTTLIAGALYALMRFGGLGMPAAGRLSAVDAAAWRSRVLSTAHALVLIVGSLLCFSEWPYSGAEGWISAPGRWSHPVTFASIFVGYLQWDWLWCVWHLSSHKDYASVVHHSLFIAVAHSVLHGWYFKLPFAWLAFAELSTPFLNGRWFLAVLGRKEGGLYDAVSVAFALTFLLTRVLGYGIGIAHLWMQRALWLPEWRGLALSIAGVHAGFGLNLFWGASVGPNLVKAVRRALKSEPSAKQRVD